ncbi:T9SS type A sorting domain-containing protein [Chryseobacterium lacus]|uniref:T9SS C-terminal target domain-containing protein n=1 Tax=Chryseobacterium lacus TaxID=2058346 RepID=A0A368N2W1_9FLAO|nr:T9SS type A sorting domain-containing protein [Chryseobacterium lacus]RCU43599.1 T9SS C-terminal target domain-containing protein [Chryseobacterium lacus]RST28616.1 T9SS type A sorting domain-containing protein [Chryseobacterium lacus]
MNQKIYIISALFTCLMLQAQNYTWQWAQYGGGDQGSSGSGFTYFQDESIRDIAVDSNNNYYYLATVNPGSPTLNGTPVTSYHGQDLFLFSTDCQGSLRWTKTIGGRLSLEYGWNIELDNNGGLYLLGSFYTTNYVTDPAPIPIHFDTNVTLPLLTVPSSQPTTIDPALKTSYLLKYNTSDGNLAWQQALQGDVSWTTRQADSAIFTMDSAKNIHAILGFRAGTHLNGLVTVPSTFTNTYQYYLVKFNYTPGTGNTVNMTPQANPLLLPMTGSLEAGMVEGQVFLLFDETLNRYYITGKRESGSSGSYFPLSYNNNAFTQDGFLLSLDGTTGAELWRKEFYAYQPLPRNRIHGIVKDNASNIYISGLYFHFNPNNTLTATFGNYNFPSSNGNTPVVLKVDSAGNVQWSKSVDGYANSVVAAGYGYSKGPLVLNGNEVAFVKGSQGDQWGTHTMTRPANDDGDPLLVRLNKETGAVIGAHEILSTYGSKDEFTSIAVDNDGNYVVGGFKHGSLFMDPNDGVPELHGNTTSGKSQFFFAKLATSSSCTQMNTTETPLKQTDVVFYPNPVNDVLHIKTKEKLTSYEVITADGRLMKQGKFTRNHTIDMSGVTPGVYYVKVQGDGFATAGKIVKK